MHAQLEGVGLEREVGEIRVCDRGRGGQRTLLSRSMIPPALALHSHRVLRAVRARRRLLEAVPCRNPEDEMRLRSAEVE